MVYQKRKRPSKKRLYIVSAVALVVILAGLGLYHASHNQAAVLPTGPETKGETATSSTASPGTGSTKTSSGDTSQDKSTTSSSSSSDDLIIPTGNFVSNHHPNLSGHPAPSQMASNCTTTPGATCQITLTMDGTTKSLAAKTTDAQGSAYWNWTLQSAGLTEGTWTVKAVATLGNKTSTATDAQGLVVSP